MMIKSLCDALLRRVYYPVTAVVSMDGAGKVLGVELFDTDYGEDMLRIPQQAEQIAVICNRPEGVKRLRREERRNIRWLCSLAHGRPMKAYICGEEFECVEVDSGEMCDIMGESM